MNYPSTSPDSRCGLSHSGRTLDYLLDEKEATDELTLRKIVAMEEEGSRRVSRARKKNMQNGLRHEILNHR